MPALLFVALLVVPLAELWLILQVADGIGVLNTIGALIAISVLGAWLLKQQGMATWTRLRETMARGHMPTNELADGALILFGGALLLTPGFITDVVGMLLLIPPTRATFKGTARRLLGRWATRRFGGGVRSTTAVRIDRREEPMSSRTPLSRDDGERREGGSPDRR